MLLGIPTELILVEHFDIKSRISFIPFLLKYIEPLHIIPYPLPGGFLELQYIPWGNLATLVRPLSYVNPSSVVEAMVDRCWLRLKPGG